MSMVQKRAIYSAGDGVCSWALVLYGCIADMEFDNCRFGDVKCCVLRRQRVVVAKTGNLKSDRIHKFKNRQDYIG